MALLVRKIQQAIRIHALFIGSAYAAQSFYHQAGNQNQSIITVVSTQSRFGADETMKIVFDYF